MIEPSEKEIEAGCAAACLGVGSLLFVMGWCGMKHGFWGAVMGTGLGLLAFLIVTELVFQLIIKVRS